MATIRDQIKAAIFGQESSSGRADTSKENYAGARGPMQVTRSTFEGMKSKGMIPNDWTHDNPEQTKEAGNRLIDSYADQYGEDPAKIAAAYYAGPKAIRKDGSIADFRDLKNPKAPTTLQYVADIQRRLGIDSTQAGNSVVSGAGPKPPTLDDWSNIPMPGPKEAKLGRAPKETFDTLPPAAALTPADVPNTEVQGLEAETAANIARSQEYEDTGFLTIAQKQFMHQGLLGLVGRTIAAPKFAVQPGYVPRELDKDLYAGRSEADHQFLDEAVSHEDALYRSMEIENRNDDLRIASSHGTGMAIAAGLVGGLPEGYLTGLGAARAFSLARTGAASYAARGQAGKALAASFAEQAVGNLGSVALQSAFDPYVSKEDAGYALGFSLLGAGLHGFGLKAEADAARVRQAGEAGMADAAAKMQAYRDAAVKNLGADATPEALRAEVERLEAADVKAVIEANTSAVPESRRIMPDMEELVRVEGERLKAEEAAAPTAESSSMAAKEEPLPTFDMDWQPPKEADVTKPVTDPKQVLIGNIGMMNPWNLLPEAKLREAAKAPNNRAALEARAGMTMEQMEGAKPGVYLHPDARTGLPPAALKTMQWLHEKFLPDKVIVLGKETSTSLGTHTRVPKGSIIAIKAEGWGKTLVHEFGHAVLVHKLADASPAQVQALRRFHGMWIDEYKGAKQAEGRGNLNPREVTSLKRNDISSTDLTGAKRKLTLQPKGQEASLFDVLSQHVTPDGLPRPVDLKSRASINAKEYWPNFDEMGAEQFGKYIEAAMAGEGPWKPASMPKELLMFFHGVWTKLVDLFKGAKEHGLLRADESFENFFESIRKDVKAGQTKAKRAAAGLNPDRDVKPESSAMASSAIGPSMADRIGADMIPQATAQQRAEVRAITHIHEQAEKYAKANPVDLNRLSKLLKNTVFDPISSVMLRSQNAVVRMFASEILENGGGAAGRRSNASLGKWLHERKFMGNTINDLQAQYVEWRNQNGGNTWKDYTDGELWRKFNRDVASYTESLQAGRAPVDAPIQVQRAAAVLEGAYERMRATQVSTKTVGWASLPETSRGYMPHRMSREKVLNLSTAERSALHSALVDQFIQIEGWDMSFSARLASKYIDRVRTAALGGYDAPGGIHQVGAAEVVEDALTQMGLTRGEVAAMMMRYMAAGPGHTKRRIKLDLNQMHDDGKGGQFQLLDLFETDQLKLVRTQASRVSGEVALTQHGIMGKPGLALMRRAMEFAPEGQQATAKELEAFDQAAAELLGQPYGTSAGKWADRAMQLNSLARLGGMVFQQAGEYINAITHVGAGRTLEAISGIGRLRNEARALARGEKVDNAIIGSLEVHGGAEFGTDPYKMVFPFDNGELQYQTYGADTPHFADRVLRGASHLQGKLSFWRAIHSAQHRGLAEQIVHKTMRFVREGGDDIALNDMGINAALREKLRAALPDIAQFDGSGRLHKFDITKMADKQAAGEFVQAVHRGTSQIIQGTFVGEQGKYVHSGFLRLLTQFRTFSITSVEKQWARQVGSRGPAAAIGILMGSMSVAAPLYIARVYLNSAGRKDREKYISEQLTPGRIARATLNYVSMSGLAGDFLDATSAVTGIGTPTGGRAGQGQSFVGNVVAPAAGLADDLYKGIQNTKSGTNPHDLVKSLPFSRLPALVPFVNLTDTGASQR